MKKQNIFKRSMLFAASAALLMGCVPSVEDDGREESDTQDVEAATIFMPIMSYEQDPTSSENEFTREVEEMIGMNLNFETVSQSAAEESRQLSLASGDYPEAYVLISWLDSMSKAEAVKYGQEGVFLPLNDLIEEHAPNFKNLMEDIPYLEDGITAPDGNIYALPSVNESFHSSFYAKVWINNDWLDVLDMDMPRDTEEFRDVLRAFKNDDPNGNGKQDEIPLSGEPTALGNDPSIFLLNSFLHVNGKDYLNIENGELYLAPKQEEYRKGLSYINSLYEEGLIDPETFTQNTDTYLQLGTPAGGDAVLGAGAASHLWIMSDITDEASKSYEVLPPLVGPEGVQVTPNDYGGVKEFTFAITDAASEEQAIALMKMADYFYSEEGTMNLTKGKKGLNWGEAGEGDIDLNNKPAKYITWKVDEDEDIEYGWGEKGAYGLTRELRDSIAAAEDQYSAEGYERRLYNATLEYEDYAPKENFLAETAWIAPENIDELMGLEVDVISYIEENMVQFITGEKDVKTDWDAYLEGFDRLNADRYVEIYQEAYNSVQ